MELGALEVQIFVSLTLVLGAVFVSLVCDFLKGNNEVLRERNIELSVRQETGLGAVEQPAVRRVRRKLVARAPAVAEPWFEPHKLAQAPPKPAKEASWAKPDEVDELERLAERIRGRIRSNHVEQEMSPAPAAKPPAAAPQRVELPEAAAPDDTLLPEPEPREFISGAALDPAKPAFSAKVTPIDALALERSSAAEAMHLAEDLARVARFSSQPEPAPPTAEASPVEEKPRSQRPTDKKAPELSELRKLFAHTKPDNDTAPPINWQADRAASKQQPPPPPKLKSERLTPPPRDPEPMTKAPMPEAKPAPPKLPLQRPVDPAPVTVSADAAEKAPKLEARPAPPPSPPRRPAGMDPVNLPSGIVDKDTFQKLTESGRAFQGTIVAIGVSGLDEATAEESGSIDLVKSLLKAEDLACRTSDEEFLLVFPEQHGAKSQQRIQHVSQQLWDHQIRSVGRSPVMFCWGAAEATDGTLSSAVASARERLDQTRRNRERAPRKIHNYRAVNS